MTRWFVAVASVLVCSACGERTAPAILGGTDWVVTDPGGSPRPATLSFGTDGRIGGHSGCNGYGGRYERSADRLAIADITTQEAGCPDERGAQEAALYERFGQVRRYQTHEDRLVLLGEDGPLITATRAP